MSPVNQRNAKLGQKAQAEQQLQHKIAGLFTAVDQEAEQFKQKVAELLEQIRLLQKTTSTRDAGDDMVSQLREANQNLIIATFSAQDMQAKAEAANRQKEIFLSMLAHELRNPLAPIVMAAELIGKITDAHPQLPKLHGIIQRQANHMVHLVDDLLDASRVSSGKLTLKKSTHLLSEIIDSAVETSRPFIDARQQRLSIALPSQPIVIYGDLVRLAQVFSNLLINATKFTPEYEHIAVSAHQHARTVIVSVKDNGMGVAPELQPVMFDMFTQGYSSLDRAQGGLGLGLSLVRTIVEMHDGSVKVHSDGIGFGSEFLVSLPVCADAPPQTVTADVGKVPARSRKILLIEDNVDANDALHDLLKLQGYAVTCAFDGKTGLGLALEGRFDVVICDIGLPGMDGYEVARQLRRRATEFSSCIIALSGYGQLENQHLAREAGFDHYLVKPVAMDALIRLIAASAVH